MAKEKAPEIGQRQAIRMCGMSFAERLAFIADGLPIILASAQGFWGASSKLSDHPREAEVLVGFAKEEAAKILILMDALRCPPKLIASKISKIVGYFYDHRARLIYTQVADWWSEDITRLRISVKPLRNTHYIEGNMGEYILPNSTIYNRESKLYADVEAYEDGKPIWNAPSSYTSAFYFHHVPAVLKVCEAMSELGMFSLSGLQAISDIWGETFFTEAESNKDAERLTEQLLARLINEQLPNDNASQDHLGTLYRHWPLPMYDVDLSPITVTLAQLEDEQERLFAAEVGDYY